MTKPITLAAMLLATPSFAEGEARHVVASAALTASLYLLMSSLTGREKAAKGPSLLGAAGMAFATGIALESVQSMQRGVKHLDGKDIGYNAVGVAAAAGLIIAIDF